MSEDKVIDSGTLSIRKTVLELKPYNLRRQKLVGVAFTVVYGKNKLWGTLISNIYFYGFQPKNHKL